MTKDEALKMAIEYVKESEFRPLKVSVLALLKEALTKAENESNSQPVAFNGKEYMEGFSAGKMFAELEQSAQPLSGIEVLDLFTELFGVNGTQAYAYFEPVKFARAIEQAHGIV